MKTKFIVGLWLLLIMLIMANLCHALTESQVINRFKAQDNADYVGNSVDKDCDGGIKYRTVKTYSKYDKNGEKAIRINEHNYIVTPDAKAWEIK